MFRRLKQHITKFLHLKSSCPPRSSSIHHLHLQAPILNKDSMQIDYPTQPTAATSSTDVSQRMEGSMPSSDIVVGEAVGLDPVAPAPPFRFTDLPPEVRLEIDSILIASGNISIADTNQLMRREAKSLIFEEGFIRIGTFDVSHPQYGRHIGINVPLLPPDRICQIQNNQITVDFIGCGTNYVEKEELEPIFSFIDSMRKKRTCVLLFQKFDPCAHRSGIRKMVELLKPLRAFENIYVTCQVGHVQGGPNHNVRIYPRITRAHNRMVYETVKEKWAESFGPANWHDNARQKDRFLAFRPKA